MQAQDLVVGVDVAKSELVTCVHARPESVRTLGNEALSIDSWLRTLPKGSCIAMESTGRLHRLLAELAHAAGMQVYVLNARDVYHYAKALSSRAKTDRLDAAVIARYVAEHRSTLRVWQPVRALEQTLVELLRRRQRLTDQRVAMRLSVQDMPTLQCVKVDLAEAFERALAEIDRQLQALVLSDPKLAQGVERLRTITGFGAQASIRLGVLFSSVAFRNADAIVAYSGLDPMARDSGTRRGARHLSKRGPGEIRRLLYLSAFAAGRSIALRQHYAEIKARGFASTQALVILARKLLRVAWAIWNSGKSFDPSLVGAVSACAKT